MAPCKRIRNLNSDTEKRSERSTKSEACKLDPTVPSHDDLKSKKGGRKRVNQNSVNPRGTITKRIEKTTQNPACSSIIGPDILQPQNLTVKENFPPRCLTPTKNPLDLDCISDSETDFDNYYLRKIAVVEQMVAVDADDLAREYQLIAKMERTLQQWQEAPGKLRVKRRDFEYMQDLLVTSKKSAAEIEESLGHTRQLLEVRRDRFAWYVAKREEI